MNEPWARPYRFEVTPLVEIGLLELGRWVKHARRTKGMTQQHLENITGVDQSVISRLENGRLTSLRLHRLAALVGALHDPRPPATRWT
jgi:predicted transcriptional regulator